MSKPCNHTLGHYEKDRYDCLESIFVERDFYEVSEAKELKNGSVYKFCPYCGENLDGMIDLRVKELEQMANEKAQKEKKERDLANKKHQKEVEELSLKTGLNNLPETGNFIVILNSFNPHDNRDVILAGDKKQILSSTLSCTSNAKDKRDSLSIKNIYKVPSTESVEAFIKDKGFIRKESTSVFELTEGNTYKLLDYEPSCGRIYWTLKIKDEDGDNQTSYDQFMVTRLAERLGGTFDLEVVNLRQGK